MPCASVFLTTRCTLERKQVGGTVLWAYLQTQRPPAVLKATVTVMMLQAANCRPPGVFEVSLPSDHGLLVPRLRGGKALHPVARAALSSPRVLPDASVLRRTRLVSGSTSFFAAACHCRCLGGSQESWFSLLCSLCGAAHDRGCILQAMTPDVSKAPSKCSQKGPLQGLHCSRICFNATA